VKQLIKTTSGVTASSLIREAPRADEILLVCLQGMEAVSAHLHSVLAKKPAKGIQRTDPPASHPRILLKRKFTHVIKQFFKVGSEVLFRQRAGLTKIARLKETGSGATAALKSTDGHLPLEREPVEAENHVANELAWMPLIKASTGSAKPVQASIAASVTDCKACDEKQTSRYDGCDLAGRQVLCVGGRANLYSEYRRLIEIAGGNLLIYRGGLQSGHDHLSTLLTRADMVVCPVDCVNHHTYFTVKRYCRYSGKVCVLLDRSCLPTFRKGVETLAALAASSAGATCSGA